MKITNKTDQTLVIADGQLVVEPGGTVEVADHVGESLSEQGWSPEAKKPTGKVADVKDAP